MRKLLCFLFISSILIFFALVTPATVKATYSCVWVGTGPVCVGGVCTPPIGFCRTGTVSCPSGTSMPDPTGCEGGKSYAFCVAGGNFQCIGETSGGIPGPSVVTFRSAPPLESCGIQTAIGCIPVQSEQELAGFFLGWGMGIGGGIALIMIVISTFMIMTSAGDPRKLQAGKELLTSAVSGLILLVFSAWILNFIGVDILGIFGGSGGGGGGGGFRR